MHYLVTYDITSDKLRLKTAKILEDYGDRVQESVFELADLDNTLWQNCLSRLKKKIKLEKNDSIRIYILCDACRNRIMLLGQGPKPMDDPNVIII